MEDQEKKVYLAFNNAEAWYTSFLTEAAWDLSKLQMDILLMVLAGIRNLAKIENNENMDEKTKYLIALENSKKVTYIVDNANFNELKGYNNYNSAATRFAEFNPRSRKFKPHIAKIIDLEQQKEYKVFETCLYSDSKLRVKLDTEFIDALVSDFKRSRYTAFIKARFYLKLQKEVSKKIYIMCRKFCGKHGGKRFIDTEWEEFLLRIGIRKNYSYSMIKSKFIEPAKTEINEYSDIIIDYNIKEQPTQGGKQPKSITFVIQKKAL